MKEHLRRILCVGTDRILHETRCMILNQAGYQARWALPDEVEQGMLTDSFDLVLVSWALSPEHKERLLRTVLGTAPTLFLDHMYRPEELLFTLAELAELKTQVTELAEPQHQVSQPLTPA